MKRTIIKNGILATSSDVIRGDLEIQGEIIASISSEIKPNSDDIVIDAEGCYVLPGGIDVHTHLAWPFQETGTADDFESGTKAAAVGGITSIINFTNPVRGQSLLTNLAEWKKKATTSAVDFGFHSIIQQCDEQVLEELPLLAEQEGVTSIKLFMAYKNELMVNDVDMYKIMKKAGEVGILTNVHAENGDVIDQLIEESLANGNTSPIYHAFTRPPQLEAEATGRALYIAEMANAPIYIVHVSCQDALEQVQLAKKRGVKAFGETCPHYLILDQSYLELEHFEGGKYVCSPPLREKRHQETLWKGIRSGSISVIGSDHCPFRFEDQKMLGKNDFSKIPNGVPGLEDMFSLFFHFGVQEKRISLTEFVKVMSTNPAKLFGLYPKKGSIVVGGDADLVIVDPTKWRTISKVNQYQRTDYNLYEGTKVQCSLTHVLSRGEIISQAGKFKGELGRGKYLFRKKFTGLT